MNSGSMDSGCQKANEDVLTGLPAHCRKNCNADEAIFGFGIR